jgi:hypothetical protein
MPIKSRHVFPPGGWQFFQAETGWKMPGGKTFNEAVKSIQTHRLSNPRFGLSVTELEEVAKQLETFTCFRIGFDPDYCNPEPEKKTLPPTPQPQPLPSGEPSGPQVEQSQSQPQRGFLARLAGLSDGARILKDWLGDGAVPVAGDLAEQRAVVCEGCPFNMTEGKPLKKLVAKIATAIKEQAEVKNLVELRVSNEAKLGSCSACGCHLFR